MHRLVESSHALEMSKRKNYDNGMVTHPLYHMPVFKLMFKVSFLSPEKKK